MGTLKDTITGSVGMLRVTANRKGYTVHNAAGVLLHEAKNPKNVDSDPETNLQRGLLWAQTHG